MLCKPILSQTDQSDSLPCVLRGRGGLIIYLQLLVSDFDSVHMENWEVLVECPGMGGGGGGGGGGAVGGGEVE